MLSAQAIREKIQNSLLKDVKLGDDKPFVNPYAGEKSAILLETRAFNESPLNPKKCCQTLTKVLYLTTTGQCLSAQQTSDLFFGITKLFQCKHERLRRMVYLLIKSLEVSETEVFIVTSSLTKDMNCANDCYRANAIRVLSRIVDASMAAQIERYLKTAIVDKNPFVASSALLCGIQLLRTAPEVVRRWVNEVSESISSRNPMVQFHSLALLYQLKHNDRLALQKVVAGLTKSYLKSPLAECLLIRYAASLAEKETSLTKSLMEYLEGCLRHKSEVVTFEAARALCHLAAVDVEGQGGTTVFGYDLIPAITVLQIMLSSPKPVARFAAVRVLNRLAQVRGQVVSRCNVDMEPMLTDSNRSIATLALTTLLKTGHEANVDRLIKQITSFMSEITDSFKVDIVEAVKQLCVSYPAKHKVLMGFLSSNLREEGSLEFKSDTVDALMLLVKQVPQAQEMGLLQLCEFIEDCEYPSLCTRILTFLGEQTPTTSCPSKFIRFIYNRLILENALVRVAGVDALMAVAHKCPSLRRDIMALLECCSTDNDDEVRDRTNLYHRALAVSLGETTAALKACRDGPPTASSSSPSTMQGRVVDLLEDLLPGGGSSSSNSDDDGGEGKEEKDEDGSSTAASAADIPCIDELLDSRLPVALNALCSRLEELTGGSLWSSSSSGAVGGAEEGGLQEGLLQDVGVVDVTQLPSEEEYAAQQKQEDALAAAATAAAKQGGAKTGLAAGRGGVGSAKGGVDAASSLSLLGTGGSSDSVLLGRSKAAGMAAELRERLAGLLEQQTDDQRAVQLNKLEHSTKPMALTEREAEYTVQLVKHLFDGGEAIVLEFFVTNTLQDQCLANVEIQLGSFDETVWAVVGGVSIPTLAFDVTNSAYVLIRRLEDCTEKRSRPTAVPAVGGGGVFQVLVKFLIREQSDDVGYEDEYPVEPFCIEIGDYLVPRMLRPGDFKAQWDGLEAPGMEAVSKFSLNFKTLDAAVEGLLKSLNLAACEKSDAVEPHKANQTLLLSGSFVGGWQVLCKAMLVMSAEYGCLLKIACRSKHHAVCEAIIQSFE